MQSSINYESMQRYVSPVNPAIFPHLTLLLLGIGIFFTAWFFVYEVTSTKLSRDLIKELIIALVAALFSGFGTLFLLLSAMYAGCSTNLESPALWTDPVEVGPWSGDTVKVVVERQQQHSYQWIHPIMADIYLRLK